MDKIKENKATVIATLLVALVPMIVGICLWNQMPDTIATHFGSDGTANGWNSKGFAVYGLPLFLLAAQVVMIIVMATDPSKKGISDRLFRLILWFMPLVSVYCCVGIYAVAVKGEDYSMSLFGYNFCLILIGVVLMVFGNALPKARLNYSFGIRVRWTLSSTKNWEATHRFGSYIMFAGGFLIFILGVVATFVSMDRILGWLSIAAITIVMIAVMTLYSYIYYLKHKNDPDYNNTEEQE